MTPITLNQRGTPVLTSNHDHHEPRHLHRLETRALWAHEMSDEDVAALKDAWIDPRQDHLNALVDDEAR